MRGVAVEHRSNFRVKILHRVHAKKRNAFLGSFYATDIGYGGAFISGCDTGISKGDIVTIVGRVSCECEEKHYQMSAMVVHIRADGIGLMWIESDSEIQSTLIDILPMAA